jgi:hypothetical protein
LPVPADGEGEAQAVLAEADQRQVLCVRTSIVRSPPDAGAVVSGADTLNRHGAGSCATLADSWAIVMAPRRAIGSTFSETR